MEVPNEVAVDKTFLPTVLLTDAENFNLCTSNALTELIVYIILDFANGPSQYISGDFIIIVLISSGGLSAQEPYLASNSLPKPSSLAGIRTSANANCKAESFAVIESIQTTTYLGGTLREKFCRRYGVEPAAIF